MDKKTILVISKNYSPILNIIKHIDDIEWIFLLPDYMNDTKEIESTSYQFTKINLKKIDEIIKTIDSYHLSNIEGIISIEELYQETAAYLRSHYQTKGLKMEDISRFRDKLVMKKFALEKKVKVPEFEILRNWETTKEFLHKHNKVVIKPVNGVGSMSTFIVDSEKKLKSVIDNLKINKEYILEKYIDGDVYHIDSLIANGKVLLNNVMKYETPAVEFKNIESLSAITLNDEALETILKNEAKRILRAFKVDNGVTHLEVFVSKGEIIFCEIAIRPGGSGIVEVIEGLYGINLNEACILLQLGKKLNYSSKILKQKKHGGWTIAFSNQNGILKNMENEDKLLKNRGIYTVKHHYKLGERVSIPKWSSDSITTITYVLDEYEETKILSKNINDMINISIDKE